uniref:Uncharacterized protein n=1 Tax=Siphoviridae sp. ctvok7 TaxID=2827596 RepID=A0A8S5LLZ6_9CAUD|nr:MAG TPA: hypothetical protein [Siphoviridae sp. ctvok7]
MRAPDGDGTVITGFIAVIVSIKPHPLCNCIT